MASVPADATRRLLSLVILFVVSAPLLGCGVQQKPPPVKQSMVVVPEKPRLSEWRPGFFEPVERRRRGLAAFTQWAEVNRRISAEEERRAVSTCAPGESSRCGYKAYMDLLRDLSGAPRQVQVRGVNRFFNAVPYGSDQSVWGQVDYWATPAEFLNARGDCEDYAVAKYRALRKLGYSSDDVRLVTVWDRKRRTHHAVTAVRLDNRVMLLDNQSVDPVDASQSTRYRYVYSVTEEYWVRHNGRDSVLRQLGQIERTERTGRRDL